MKKLLFSEYFDVDKKDIEDYGAFDISLFSDIPLFVDPLLIFNSSDEKYQQLHDQIIKYMSFLANKSQKELNNAEIITWFSFNEVINNWLGYSTKGNKGLALGKEFSKFLYKNIKFVIENNDISKGLHVEKVLLLYDGSGKDKISDLTVNLIKGFLCEFTQEFSKKYIKKDKLKIISVDKAEFNYDTESFVSIDYTLPFITNEKNKVEYVLLTPSNLLREDEPTINRMDFLQNNERVRNYIDNAVLRTQVDNYIQIGIRNYIDKFKGIKKNPSASEMNKITLNRFKEFTDDNPIIYDYYVKMKEDEDKNILNKNCFDEFNGSVNRFIGNAIKLSEIAVTNTDTALKAVDETKERLKHFKNVIENGDGYKCFYTDGKRITKEADLQRMFKFCWALTQYKVDAETNNGRGPVDFVVSKGAKNVDVIEFKLARNTKGLPIVFNQAEVYKKANNSNYKTIVIFYFDDKEYSKAISLINELKKQNEIDNTIFLIDCREKESASNVKRKKQNERSK
ncbi:MAG: hypothetical protein RR201_01130 [Malacoplasma sp.]